MHKHTYLNVRMQFVVKMYLPTLPVEYFYWIIPASPHAESAVKKCLYYSDSYINEKYIQLYSDILIQGH